MLTQQQLNSYKQKIQEVIDILPDIDKHISSRATNEAAQALTFLLYDLKDYTVKTND